METLNRTTASTAPTIAELEELGHRVRQLWSSHLHAIDDERERLIVELSAIDAQIERLSIRGQCQLLTSKDTKAAEDAAAGLLELEYSWNQKSLAHYDSAASA